jgi:hypothetical protein
VGRWRKSYAVQIERPDLLREGDLVLREGRGWRADVVYVASSYTMTHVGMLVADGQGSWNVIHAAPPEGNMPGSVRSEPLLQFTAKNQAQKVGFQRLRSSRALIDRIVSIARTEARLKTPFDDAFDLHDQRELYCTEFIWWIVNRAGHSLSPRLTRVRAGVLTGDYMTPRDLLATGDFSPVGTWIR